MSYLKFLAHNLLLFAIGFTLFHFDPVIHEFASKDGAAAWIKGGAPFVGELSIAFVIAGILNIGVEWFTRQRHHELEKATIERLNSEVSKDLLIRVFKENLPDKVVQQIRLHLFSARVCKLHWQARYELEVRTDPKDPQRKFVFWTATDEYTLRNMERRVVEHPVAMEFELSEYEDFWHILSLEVDGKAVPFPEVCVNRKMSAEHKVKLRPSQEMKIKTIQTGAGPVYSHEILCSMLSVEKLVLVVKHPADLKVDATSLHPDSAIPLANGPDGAKRWELEAVLPGQGIEVSWRPTD